MMNETLSSALHHTKPTFVLGPSDGHSLNPCFCSPQPSSVLPCLSLSCPFSPLLFECSCSSPRQPVPFYCTALSNTMPSFPTYILPSDPLLPLLIHHFLPLVLPLPPLTPSRDNYYKPCADQLVFKQLNKQRLGPLTVDIQQHLSKKLEQEIQKLCVALRVILKNIAWD